jgi:hypothetical protein
MQRRSRAAVLAAALVLGTPSAGAAFDLTGNWQGSYKCTEFEDGAKSTISNPASTAAITQSGGVLGVLIDGVYVYSGIAIAGATNPDKGEVSLVHCGTDDDLTGGAFVELGRFRVSTSGEKGKISGVSTWSNDAQHVATCKYKFKCVDVLDPAQPTVCP